MHFGQGCFLAKMDIESAFRLIPVHPDDYELLGMFWDGKYLYLTNFRGLWSGYYSITVTFLLHQYSVNKFHPMVTDLKRYFMFLLAFVKTAQLTFCSSLDLTAK